MLGVVRLFASAERTVACVSGTAGWIISRYVQRYGLIFRVTLPVPILQVSTGRNTRAVGPGL